LYNRRTILFVDEVHRWNKSQQDALLPWVENGTIILVGATTENPFFEVNKALVSRSRVFQLLPLTKEDLAKAAHAALTDKERGYGRWNVEFESGALEHLIDTANGDARSLLNALELAVETTPERWAPEETPLKSDLSSVQTPFADESLSTYRDRFFAHRSSESRTTLSCDRALIDCLRRVLNALDARTSLAAYIGNILADHIDRHRALLSEAIERNRKNPFNSSLP